MSDIITITPTAPITPAVIVPINSASSLSDGLGANLGGGTLTARKVEYIYISKLI